MQIAPDMLEQMLASGWTREALIAAGYDIVDYETFYGSQVVSPDFTVNGQAPSVPVPEVTGYLMEQPTGSTLTGDVLSTSGLTGTQTGWWSDFWSGSVGDFFQKWIPPFAFFDPLLPGGRSQPNDPSAPFEGGTTTGDNMMMMFLLMFLMSRGTKGGFMSMLPMLLLLPMLTGQSILPSGSTGTTPVIPNTGGVFY